MGTFASEGLLYKARSTLETFVTRRPSLGTLWANRAQRFERAHAILPSTAVVDEPLELTLQARDQCERLPALSEFRRDGLGWGIIWRVWNEPSYPGGLQAIYAPELTREAVFESMADRRVYGTSQPNRIIVDFRIEGVRFGERDSTVTIPAPDAAREVTLDVAGTAPVATARVIKNNEVWHTAEGSDDPDADLSTYTVEAAWTDDAPVTGMAWDDERGTDADVYYARVRQADGGMAWAGPLWVEVA